MFCIHFIMNIPPSGRLSILSKLQKFLPEHQSYTVNIFTLESLQQAIKEEAGVPPLQNITMKKLLTYLLSRKNSPNELGKYWTACVGFYIWPADSIWSVRLSKVADIHGNALFYSQPTHSSAESCNGIRMSRTSGRREHPLVSPPVRAMTGRGGGWGCPKRTTRTPNLMLFIKHFFLQICWWKSMRVEILSFNCG